jgi:hypothetical protein
VRLDEWVVNVIKAMYYGATTAVKVKNGGCATRVSACYSTLCWKPYQGNPGKVCHGNFCMWMILVLWEESEEELKGTIVRWKSGMESKGLRVNLEKIKVMRCQVVIRQVEKSGVKDPRGICGKGVSANSIKCIDCMKLIHGNKCSELTGAVSCGR